MGLMDSLYVGASGLGAASAGIDATAQNVANASTPGYTRRSVEQSVNDPILQGLVQIGTGVTVDAITRDSDSLLGMQRVDAAGTASQSAAYHDALAEVEILFDETLTDGMRSSLDAFFDSLVAATTDPADEGLRNVVLAEATDLAQGVASTASALTEAQQTLAEDYELSIPTLNSKLQEVAVLNNQLVAAGGANAAPDLADQLDRLLLDLGAEAGFTAHIEVDGSATVMLEGHAVVSGGEAREVAGTVEGMTIEVDSGVVSVQPGGRLGGLAEASQTIAGYQADLDTFAVALADSVNATLAAGFDLDGDPGAPLFTYDTTDPAASLATDPTVLATDLAFAGGTPVAAGDAANLTALIDLEDQSLVGTSTLGASLSGLTNQVGLDVSTAAAVASRDGAIQTDLDTLAANLHGVDMDEEATNLIVFQTAYQAAAKVIQVTDELLRTLMEIT